MCGEFNQPGSIRYWYNDKRSNYGISLKEKNSGRTWKKSSGAIFHEPCFFRVSPKGEAQGRAE
jgi:hypothetical protein